MCFITHLGGQYSVSRLAARGWGWCTEKGWARGSVASSEVSRPGRTILTPASLLSLPGNLLCLTSFDKNFFTLYWLLP